jgi:tol-pal system protein YbgF
MLSADINKLQRDSFSLKGDVESLKEKTAGVAKEESFNVVRMSQAEIQAQLANLAKDIQVLSGRFDENKYFIDKTLKNSTSETDLLKAQITALERQIKEMKNQVNALEGQTMQQRETPKSEPEKKQEGSQKASQSGEKETEKSAVAADKVAKYEAAYSAFKNRRFKEAREKFEAFTREFPQDELIDNAYFWVAETYYNEKDHEGAILAYETLLKKYPNSEKAAASLYKQGLSFIEIGDKKTGQVILEQLIERHPDTKEAELAKKRLADLNRKPAKKKK